MRRRVDLRWRIQPEEIERLHTAQLDLLKQAATQVNPAGFWFIARAGLEPEENSEVLKQFLSDHADFNWNPSANYCRLWIMWMGLTWHG